MEKVKLYIILVFFAKRSLGVILQSQKTQKILELDFKHKKIKDMSFLCCEWCLNMFSSEKDNKNERKSYKPSLGEDLDEEQLIQHNQNRPSKSNQLPAEYFAQEEEKIDLSNSLNVELNLNSASTRQQQDKRSQSSKSQTDQGYDLEEKDHFNENQNSNEEVTEESLKPDFTKFSINLDPYHKHFKLLHEKTENLEKYFSQEGKLIDFGQTRCNLSISKIDTFKFEVRYQLPCSYSFYSMLMKDSNPNNKKYLTLFEKHQVLEAFKQNFTKNMTKMKRFNMLQPRQFVYLKYSNGSFKQNWQICINDLQDDLLSQQASEHKRCDIFTVGNFKEINDRLYVRQYVEVDLKSSNMNPNIWGKIMHQVKEYYEKLYLHTQNYYQKELL